MNIGGPAIPLGGVAGWRFLERTEAAQRAAFDRGAELERDIAYFTENIARVTSAEELVADRTLLKVAVGAFGMDEELYKKAFLEKILAGGTDDPESLANKFVDPRYGAFAKAFGFGDVFGARTGWLGFAAEITGAYRDRQFEIAVGEKDPDLRLALGFRREIAAYAAGSQTDTAAWFKILGNKPVRTVLEAAFALPTEFATLDVDRQRETLADKTRAAFGDGTVAAFLDPENVERVIDRFLLRRQIDAGPSASTPGAAALSLLQSATGAANQTGLANLILSAS